MIPFDPIMSMIVVIGVIAYYAVKHDSSSQKKERSYGDILRDIGENTDEYKRYQKWFEEIGRAHV